MSISPHPPVARLKMPWDGPVDNPVEAIATARAELGDTFVIEGPDTSYLFLFSAVGVRAFYDLDETEASKGLADLRMLSRQVPQEVFFARRTLPHQLFGRDDVARYRSVLEEAIVTELSELDDGSEVEAFDLSRRIGHRSGIASFGGPWLTGAAGFDELTGLLDRLDPAAAFVRPDQIAGGADQHGASREALAGAVELIRDAWLNEGDPGGAGGAFSEILASWSDLAEPEALEGAALDLVVVHLASMSNLFAATGWLLCDLAHHGDAAERALEDGAFLERCAMESIRLAQRSIMLREVHGQPVTIDDGTQRWTVPPGDTIATLLPLTNTTAGPGLEHWDPDRWNKRRLADVTGLSALELVTTFGHGAHTCPAQPFSLHAMGRTAELLFSRFEVTPAFHFAAPLATQVGGVARSAQPCVLELGLRMAH